MPVASLVAHKNESSENGGGRPRLDPRRILVIGGTQFIGRLLVEELAKDGHEVSILHRKPKHTFGKHVHNFVADRNVAATVVQAVGNTRFDAVFDFAYDWDHGTTAAQVEAVAQTFEGRVSRYVFMSSVAAYGDGLNHHEGDALAPDDHPNLYARNKATSERALFRMYQRSGFPIVTLRPPFVYGPANPFYREAFFWDRMRADKPTILPSEGHRLMQFIHVGDLVELAIKVLEPKIVVGHAFNTRDMILRAGGQAIGEKLYFGYYYDVPAITQIVTKAQRMLAFKPTDFAVGLKAEYAAYLKKRGFPKPDFSFDDGLIARFGNQMNASRSA